ncbi:MAG: hypothetical protein R3F19_17980 [Verrucomicrobiales bacterium]
MRIPSNAIPDQPEGETTSRFLSRTQLAERWGVSKETIKRREREGLLSPIRFNQRLLRYRLEDVLAVETSLLP